MSVSTNGSVVIPYGGGKGRFFLLAYLLIFTGASRTAQLDAAIATTARNPTGIAPLDLTISDPPTQSEIRAIVAWLGPLLTALQRPS